MTTDTKSQDILFAVGGDVRNTPVSILADLQESGVIAFPTAGEQQAVTRILDALLLSAYYSGRAGREADRLRREADSAAARRREVTKVMEGLCRGV